MIQSLIIISSRFCNSNFNKTYLVFYQLFQILISVKEVAVEYIYTLYIYIMYVYIYIIYILCIYIMYIYIYIILRLRSGKIKLERFSLNQPMIL